MPAAAPTALPAAMPAAASTAMPAATPRMTGVPGRTWGLDLGDLGTKLRDPRTAVRGTCRAETRDTAGRVCGTRSDENAGDAAS